MNPDQLITRIQEVYFDLCDAHNDKFLVFYPEADTPQGFESADEWVEEQRNKLAEIEDRVKDLCRSHGIKLEDQ
jgi:hypothetical protein